MRFLRAPVLGTLVVLLLGVVGPTLLPRPVAAGTEPPSALATAYNTQRKLAATPDGILYAAIAANVSGVPTARVLWTGDGASWSALAPPPTSGESDRTSLAVDSRGALHLAWTEVAGGDRQVMYAAYARSAWSARVQLSHSPGYAGFPSVAVDARDRVHVAWYATDGTFYQIYYRRLEPGGWTAETALTSANQDANNPAIAVGPDGAIHLAWARVAIPRPFLEIAYLRLQGDEVADLRSISTPDVDSFAPSLVLDSEGTVHVAWHAANRIVYAKASPAWSAPVAISPSAILGRNPSLALDASGRLYAAWEGLDGGIYLQTREGTGWSGAVLVSTGGVNHYPSTRWSQYGNPLCGRDAGIDIVWTEDRNGTFSLMHLRVSAPAACPAPAGGSWSVIAVLSIPAAVGAAAFAIDRRRRRRVPPTGEDEKARP